MIRIGIPTERRLAIQSNTRIFDLNAEGRELLQALVKMSGSGHATASLLCHSAAERTVVDLPLAYLSSRENVISVRALLRDVVPDLRSVTAADNDRGRNAGPGSVTAEDGGAADKNAPRDAVCDENGENTAASASSPPAPSKPALGRGMNYFTSFIEEMERKYTAHHTGMDSDSDSYAEGLEQGAHSDDSGADSDGSDDSGDEAEDGEAGEKGKDKDKKAGSKKLKRKKRFDYYDLDDDGGSGDEFNIIDDSALGREVEAALYCRHSRTEHSGFFVSAGELKVLPPPPSIGIVGAGSEADNEAGFKRKRAPSGPRQKAAPKPPAAPAPLAADMWDLAPADIGHLLVTASNPPVLAAPLGSDANASSASASAGDGEKQPKKVKLRPLWEPGAAALRAFGVFKAQVVALGVEAGDMDGARPVPRVLEEPLGALDYVVQREHGQQLKRQTGYLESLSAVLGGRVSVGKLKRLLSRMSSRSAAEAARLALEKAVSALVLDIRAATVPYNNSSSKIFLNGTPRSPKGGGDEDEDASKSLTPPASPGRACSSGSYSWYCRWAAAMRSALERLEGLTQAWVGADNRKRKALTVEEKRLEGLDGLPPSDPREELQRLLQRLCRQAFPAEGCKGADVASLRKIIVGERKRRIRQAEEQQAQRKAGLTQGGTDAGAASGGPAWVDGYSAKRGGAAKELRLTCKPRLSREFGAAPPHNPDDFVESSNLGGGSGGVKEL